MNTILLYLLFSIKPINGDTTKPKVVVCNMMVKKSCAGQVTDTLSKSNCQQIKRSCCQKSKK